jgi:hypothetical protein
LKKSPYPRIKPDPTAKTAKELGRMSLEDCLAYWLKRDPALVAACLRIPLPPKKVTPPARYFMDLSQGADK